MDKFEYKRSFWEASKQLDALEAIEFNNAICEFALNGKEVELKGITKAIFELVKPQIKQARPARKSKPVNESSENIEEIKYSICNFFGRRKSTKWSDKENKALRNLLPIDEEDLDLLDVFYTAQIPKSQDYRRTSIQTLLNNWQGEIDKARSYVSNKKGNWEANKLKSEAEVF